MNLPKQWVTTGCIALLAASLAPAQSSTAASATKDDLSPSKLELDFFAGAQLFHKRPDPLQTKLLNSTVLGMRFTQNVFRYWSFEESLSGSTLADLTLIPVAGAGNAPRIDLEQRVWKFGVNPVYHLTPLGSRLRPYLTIGYTQAYFSAVSDGLNTAARLTPVAATGYKSSSRPAMNYGGGFKYRFTDLIGMRVDVRGLWSSAPTWGLPNGNAGLPAGAIYIPKGGSLHGIEATAGIGFSFGGKGATVAPSRPTRPVAAPETAPAPRAVEQPKPAVARTFELSPIEASPSTGYAGENFTFRTRLTDSAGGSNIKWVWTVDGAEQSGANGPEFSTTGLGAGTHTIKVTATDPATGATASQTYSITINPVPPLTITDSAAKNDLKFGETTALTAQGSESAYSGRLTYTWNTNVGTIQGSGANVTFDSSSVPFDPANVFKQETRTATVTPTVTDQRGRTATGAPLQIRISKDPKTMRLDDLVYGRGSARVNNCAKRILIDDLQKIMNDNPDVEVLLIGHTDASEPTKGAKGRVLHLDQQRVLNAAAVMTAGTGVCAKCDLARIQVSYAGTDQTSDFKSGFCGTSTRQKSDERKADEIAADDAAAKNRRVEIWIVPKGVSMPAGAKDPKPAPVAAVKAKGCPK